MAFCGSSTPVFASFSKWLPAVSQSWFLFTPLRVHFCNENAEPANRGELAFQLLEHLFATFTEEGNWVLDVTGGSGASIDASLRLGRSLVCMDRDANQFRCWEPRRKAVLDRMRTELQESFVVPNAAMCEPDASVSASVSMGSWDLRPDDSDGNIRLLVISSSLTPSAVSVRY